jgi:hypothetical protein
VQALIWKFLKVFWIKRTEIVDVIVVIQYWAKGVGGGEGGFGK